MTEDELTAMLVAKGRTNFCPDPAICSIASRHILAFMADLNADQQRVVMGSMGRLVGELDMLESLARGRTAPRRVNRSQPTPKRGMLERFTDLITLEWL